MKDVLINHEPVELYKILKFEGIADSGAAAKAIIDEGNVLVNGNVETRRRNKIKSGDLIEVGGKQYKIVLATPAV